MADPPYVRTLRRMLVEGKRGTLTQVAEDSGIPYHTLKGISGGRGTTAENWDRIAQALGRVIVIAEPPGEESD